MTDAQAHPKKEARPFESFDVPISTALPPPIDKSWICALPGPAFDVY